MRLFIFGAGYSATHFARLIGTEAKWIGGTSRSLNRFTELSSAGIAPFLFGGARTLKTAEALRSATHLIISIAPPREADDASIDPVLDAFASDIAAMSNLEWIGYLSTVGVYGNHGGAWVDEDTTARPVSARSKSRVKAENAWREIAEACATPLSIPRLSGIYGPGRNVFKTIEEGRARRLVKPGQVFNRVHVGDIAKAVRLAALARANGIFNITDDEPAPPQDVVTFACELMAIEPPPEQDFDTADLTPMARSFYGENKRVSNAKSKRELSMVYDWPDYRTALRRMWTDGSWR